MRDRQGATPCNVHPSAEDSWPLWSQLGSVLPPPPPRRSPTTPTSTPSSPRPVPTPPPVWKPLSQQPTLVSQPSPPRPRPPTTTSRPPRPAPPRRQPPPSPPTRHPPTPATPTAAPSRSHLTPSSLRHPSSSRQQLSLWRRRPRPGPCRFGACRTPGLQHPEPCPTGAEGALRAFRGRVVQRDRHQQDRFEPVRPRVRRPRLDRDRRPQREQELHRRLQQVVASPGDASRKVDGISVSGLGLTQELVSSPRCIAFSF